MNFSATRFLSKQEGLLAQACLCNGLTALRRANLGDKNGLFYSSFFELSIGFERVFKLVLILDHMAHNRLAPPDSKTVEDYGHKLRALFDAAQAVCAARGKAPLGGLALVSCRRRRSRAVSNFCNWPAMSSTQCRQWICAPDSIFQS